jgi:hypothetical protein
MIGSRFFCSLVETKDSVRVLVPFRFKPAHVLGTPSGVGVVFLAWFAVFVIENLQVAHSRTILLILGTLRRGLISVCIWIYYLLSVC